MASLLACGSCAALSGASCLSNMACSCFGQLTKHSSYLSRAAFTSIFFGTTLTAWAWYVWGRELYDDLPNFMAVRINCTEAQCFGTMSVYRFSFMLFMFFIIHALASATDCCSRQFNRQWWGTKIILLLVAIFGSFFLQNPIFSSWAWVAMIGAGVFLILQLTLLVDFVHSWSESWVDKMNDSFPSSNKWYYYLIGTTTALYLGAIGMTIAEYVLFTKGESCHQNTMFITFNLLFCLLGTFISIHPTVQQKNPRSGLMQSATVSLYTSYLIWSAMTSQPEGICSKISEGDERFSAITGAILVFISVCYSAFRFSTQTENLISRTEEGRILTDEDDDDERRIDDQVPDPPEDDSEFKGFASFHISFALASCYIAMLITNWMFAIQSKGEENYVIDKSVGSMWVKVACSWLAHLLYNWSLVAPIFLPNRDFS